MNPHLLTALFVKAPLPGRVKTRLGREIGDNAACQIYCSLVERILLEIRKSAIPFALFYDGAAAEQLPFTWREQAVAVHQQIGEGLGERMAGAFRQMFADGYTEVLLCGSDIVGLDSAYLKEAAAMLEQTGMVIAPAEDGGYCLIGFTEDRFNPLVFERISWSTDQVFSQTLERCMEVGLEPALLGTLRDIDTVVDLVAAAPELLMSLKPKGHVT